MMRFLNEALFLSLFSVLGSSLCGSVSMPMNNSLAVTFSDSDTMQINYGDEAYSYTYKSLTSESESDSKGCKRGPRGKTGHQGKRGFQGSGPKLDIPSLTVAIDDFPTPSGDFTFNIILISPDGREVGTPVFSSTDLPAFPVLLTLPGPLYTGTYLLTAEIVSVNVPGSIGIVATTFNPADTNLYGIQSGITAINSLIGQRATVSAFAVP